MARAATLKFAENASCSGWQMFYCSLCLAWQDSRMPSLQGLIRDSVPRFKIVHQGKSPVDMMNLLTFAILEAIPNHVRKPGSALDTQLSKLAETLLSTTIIRIDDLKYRVRNSEGLTILSPNFEAFMRFWFQPKKGDVFVDIGAHIGKYAIAAAKAVGPEGMVIALEPHPETFQVLRKNAEMNRLSNLKALNLGAWNTSGILKFYVGASASEFSAVETGLSKTVDVQTRQVDDLLSELKVARVDWVKIDVEKAEIEVLEGLTETLAKFKPNIFMEVWVQNRKKVQAFLKARGYSIIMVSNSLGSTEDWCVYLVCINTAK
jgi:FkbM family methyltransferase